jgi:hypothetical protein
LRRVRSATPDLSAKRFRDLKMHFKTTTLYRAPLDCARWPVRFQARLSEVLEVNTGAERFGATLIIKQEWLITRIDAVDYVGSANRGNWTPNSYMLPLMGCENAATNRDNADLNERVKSVPDPSA